MACGGMISQKILNFVTKKFSNFLTFIFKCYYCSIDLTGSRNIQGFALIRAVSLAFLPTHSVMKMSWISKMGYLVNYFLPNITRYKICIRLTVQFFFIGRMGGFVTRYYRGENS